MKTRVHATGLCELGAPCEPAAVDRTTVSRGRRVDVGLAWRHHEKNLAEHQGEEAAEWWTERYRNHPGTEKTGSLLPTRHLETARAPVPVPGRLCSGARLAGTLLSPVCLWGTKGVTTLTTTARPPLAIHVPCRPCTHTTRLQTLTTRSSNTRAPCHSRPPSRPWRGPSHPGPAMHTTGSPPGCRRARQTC